MHGFPLRFVVLVAWLSCAAAEEAAHVASAIQGEAAAAAAPVENVSLAEVATVETERQKTYEPPVPDPDSEDGSEHFENEFEMETDTIPHVRGGEADTKLRGNGILFDNGTDPEELWRRSSYSYSPSYSSGSPSYRSSPSYSPNYGGGRSYHGGGGGGDPTVLFFCLLVVFVVLIVKGCEDDGGTASSRRVDDYRPLTDGDMTAEAVRLQEISFVDAENDRVEVRLVGRKMCFYLNGRLMQEGVTSFGINVRLRTYQLGGGDGRFNTQENLSALVLKRDALFLA